MDLPALDKRQIRAAFARAARTYDGAAALQRTVAARMLDRLDYVRLGPEVVLDVGCGTGYGTALLARRYPRARLVGADLAHAMAERARGRVRSPWRAPRRWLARLDAFVCGDAESLPLAAGSVDLVVSNLTLQWCQPETVFREFLRVLRPGGLLMFTTFGPDSLKELRNAWSGVDNGVHVHEFPDMHELGDLLVHTGFADPVLDVDRLMLTYDEVPSVLRELKQLGAHNAARARPRGLTGKRHYARFVENYERLRRDGRIPATYEVVYGHAWAPAVNPERINRGEATVPLAAIRRR